MNLKVNELFYSLQGEGGRQGEASIFIRLSDCNLQCPFCDTPHTEGTLLSIHQILRKIRAFPCQWIVWTGGEPTLQLTDDITLLFKQEGYQQAIESNGLLPLPAPLDYTVVSPKGTGAEVRAINPRVHEVRLPVVAGQDIPPIETFPMADLYFLSPVFAAGATEENIRYCVETVKRNPAWRLSVQLHSLIGIP
jgi:organic radical activating enzyme